MHKLCTYSVGAYSGVDKGTVVLYVVYLSSDTESTSLQITPITTFIYRYVVPTSIIYSFSGRSIAHHVNEKLFQTICFNVFEA